MVISPVTKENGLYDVVIKFRNPGDHDTEIDVGTLGIIIQEGELRPERPRSKTKVFVPEGQTRKANIYTNTVTLGRFEINPAKMYTMQFTKKLP